MTATMSGTATADPSASRTVRLPLQTGGGSLGSLLLAAFIWAGAAFSACWSFIILKEGLNADAIAGPLAAGALGAFFALGFALWTFSARREFRRQRASDVEIGAAGLRFIDGPWDGEVVPWSEVENCVIVSDTSRYVQTKVNGRVVSTEYLERLLLRRYGVAAPLMLAESLNHAEKQSFEELQQSIIGAREARLGRQVADDAPDPAVSAASVLQCQSCGRPVPPRDAAEVDCPSCGARVPFDAETRERIRAASAASDGIEELERVVAGLLDQPSARVTNRPIEILDKLVLTVPVAAAALYFVPDPIGGLLPALRLLGVGFLAAVAVGCFAGTRIVKRQALRELTTGMGARNAARPGEPPRCRQCGGSLLIRQDRVVAVCLFCQSENLLGLDLRPAAAAAQSRLYRLQPIVSKQAGKQRAALVAAVLFSLLALRLLLGLWM